MESFSEEEGKQRQHGAVWYKRYAWDQSPVKRDTWNSSELTLPASSRDAGEGQESAGGGRREIT